MARVTLLLAFIVSAIYSLGNAIPMSNDDKAEIISYLAQMESRMDTSLKRMKRELRKELRQNVDGVRSLRIKRQTSTYNASEIAKLTAEIQDVKVEVANLTMAINDLDTTIKQFLTNVSKELTEGVSNLTKELQNITSSLKQVSFLINFFTGFSTTTKDPWLTTRTWQTSTTSPPTSSSLNCTFDFNICAWTQSTTDDFDWTRNRGSTSSSSTGPSWDVSSTGYYMYIETSSPRLAGDKAMLESPWVSDYNQPLCLSFWYHMYGSTIGTLEVGTTWGQLWSVSGNQGDTWYQANVSIPASQGIYQIYIGGISGGQYTGDSAIDNIIVTNGRCINPTTTTTALPPTTTQIPATALDCTFDYHLCSWTQTDSSNDDFDWTRQRGFTLSSSTGPASDHTGNGYYMYIETSSPRLAGDTAMLESPWVSDYNQSFCLSFWYHMYGSTIGTLEVGTTWGQLWSVSGNQGNTWYQANVNIPASQGIYQIYCKGISGGQYTSDIAIDDITVTNGTCIGLTTTTLPPNTTTTQVSVPSSMMACDFDTNMCLWTNSATDDFDWTRRYGSTDSYDTGPSSDNSGGGSYMYIESSSPRITGDTAVLWGPPIIDSQTKQCLTFWYHMYGDSIGTLSVNVANTSGGQETELWRRSYNQGNFWQRTELYLPDRNTYQINFKAVCGSSFTSDIAIDDISAGPCLNVSVHLVNGSVPHEGRVQVRYNGTNGTICDDSFDTADATVICRMLGYGYGIVAHADVFGPGPASDLILMDDVHCVGNESSITDCSFSGWRNHNCDHREDVGVVCSNNTSPTISVHLVNGATPHEGRVQVRFSGRNGTICDDYFDDAAATVICRMLGHRYGEAVYVDVFGPGPASDLILMDDVHCVGNESSITDCSFSGWGNHDCNHREDVGVVCSNKTASTTAVPSPSTTTAVPSTSTTTAVPSTSTTTAVPSQSTTTAVPSTSTTTAVPSTSTTTAVPSTSTTTAVPSTSTTTAVPSQSTTTAVPSTSTTTAVPSTSTTTAVPSTSTTTAVPSQSTTTAVP